MDVSNCLEMMILSDTLAINGVFNKAAKSALWDAHTVTHSEDFLHICQVLHFDAFRDLVSVLPHTCFEVFYLQPVNHEKKLCYPFSRFATKQSGATYLLGLADV